MFYVMCGAVLSVHAGPCETVAAPRGAGRPGSAGHDPQILLLVVHRVLLSPIQLHTVPYMSWQ